MMSEHDTRRTVPRGSTFTEGDAARNPPLTRRKTFYRRGEETPRNQFLKLFVVPAAAPA
jgi:hypothetical protein